MMSKDTHAPCPCEGTSFSLLSLFLAIKRLHCTTCSLFNGVEDFYYIVQAPFSYSFFASCDFHFICYGSLQFAWLQFTQRISESLFTCTFLVFLVSSSFPLSSLASLFFRFFSLLFSSSTSSPPQRPFNHFIYFASHLSRILFHARAAHVFSFFFCCLEYFLQLLQVLLYTRKNISFSGAACLFLVLVSSVRVRCSVALAVMK